MRNRLFCSELFKIANYMNLARGAVQRRLIGARGLPNVHTSTYRAGRVWTPEIISKYAWLRYASTSTTVQQDQPQIPIDVTVSTD